MVWRFDVAVDHSAGVDFGIGGERAGTEADGVVDGDLAAGLHAAAKNVERRTGGDDLNAVDALGLVHDAYAVERERVGVVVGEIAVNFVLDHPGPCAAAHGLREYICVASGVAGEGISPGGWVSGDLSVQVRDRMFHPRLCECAGFFPIGGSRCLLAGNSGRQQRPCR